MKAGAFFCAAALAFFVGAPARGGIAGDAGTRGAQFLRYEPGGRHAALGGTYAAYGNDAFSLWGQPAALADAGRINVALQHASLFQDVSQEYVGIILPFRGTRAAGVTVNYVDAGDLLRATEDAAGNLASLGGNFESRDLAVGLHYGQNFGENFSVGGAVRIIDSKIDDRSATGYAADLGLRYRVLPRLTVGASLTNAGHGLRFIQKRDDLPSHSASERPIFIPLRDRAPSSSRATSGRGRIPSGNSAGASRPASSVPWPADRLPLGGRRRRQGPDGRSGFRVGDPEGNHAGDRLRLRSLRGTGRGPPRLPHASLGALAGGIRSFHPRMNRRRNQSAAREAKRIGARLILLRPEIGFHGAVSSKS